MPCFIARHWHIVSTCPLMSKVAVFYRKYERYLPLYIVRVTYYILFSSLLLYHLICWLKDSWYFIIRFWSVSKDSGDVSKHFPFSKKVFDWNAASVWSGKANTKHAKCTDHNQSYLLWSWAFLAFNSNILTMDSKLSVFDSNSLISSSLASSTSKYF